jgi:hypothetical protein
MTSTDTRRHWLETHKRLSASTDSQSVAFGILAAYDELAECQKEVVHQILADWLVSEDNKLRYDACFIISERHVVALRPAVERAIEWVAHRSGPEAEHEAEKLRRILSSIG